MFNDSAPNRLHRTRWWWIAALFAAVACGLLYVQPAESASEGPSALDVPRSRPHEVELQFTEEPDHLRVDTSDGVVPDGVSVYDDEYPAVAMLEPDLLTAIHDAADDAAGDGVRFVVNSGWRSPSYQEQLLAEAIHKYGSATEAARWVATPETSEHVAGEAIDIGPPGSASWLADNGAAYGLCQIYMNEPWHFELRPKASVRGCPPPFADPTQDPRLQS